MFSFNFRGKAEQAPKPNVEPQAEQGIKPGDSEIKGETFSKAAELEQKLVIARTNLEQALKILKSREFDYQETLLRSGYCPTELPEQADAREHKEAAEEKVRLLNAEINALELEINNLNLG